MGPLINITTPYNVSESIYWLIKYFIGPSRKNSGIIKSIPPFSLLNNNVTPKYTLVFAGDIMPMRKRQLNFSARLKEFVARSDYFIGNFEGTITEQAKKSWFSPSDQRHDRGIIDSLAAIFPPEKTYLSVANNHAADFGKEEFFASVNILESCKFKVFGWNERPFVDVNDDIRLIAGTMWSNRKCDYIAGLQDSRHYTKPQAANILYAHFGYEHELFPRPKTVKMAKQLLHTFDAVIGHHSHCPQPVNAETTSGINKLLVYSLGNFCGAFRARKYQYGIVVKADLGKSESGVWLTQKVDWRLTKCSLTPSGGCTVDLSNDNLLNINILRRNPKLNYS